MTPSFTTEKEAVEAFEKEFPQVQQSPTHYFEDNDGHEDCKCIGCNAEEYHPRIKEFLSQVWRSAEKAGMEKVKSHYLQVRKDNG